MKKIILRASLPIIFRLLATTALLVFVFFETGLATMAAFGLIVLWIELHSLVHRLENIKRDLFGPLRDLSAISSRFAPKNTKN